MNQKQKINSKISTINYKTCSDKRIIVNVSFGYYEENDTELSTKQIPMIVDTGANSTVLNIEFAKDIGFVLNKRRTPKIEIETAGTKREIAYKFIVPKMELEDNGNVVVKVKNLEILTYNMPVDAQEFGGILGLDFFNDKKVCLDLFNQTLDVT